MPVLDELGRVGTQGVGKGIDLNQQPVPLGQNHPQLAPDSADTAGHGRQVVAEPTASPRANFHPGFAREFQQVFEDLGFIHARDGAPPGTFAQASSGEGPGKSEQTSGVYALGAVLGIDTRSLQSRLDGLPIPSGQPGRPRA